MDAFDAVVVGAGMNGLAAAVHLLSRRWSVAVIEQAAEPGGAVKTREVTLPGFRHECAAGSGVRDGGWPPAIGLQERVANRRKRRWSKARVVSVTEKALQRRQVGDRKANIREPPFKCRKCSDDVETGELCCAGISLDDAC